jgi:hypothetical protein
MTRFPVSKAFSIDRRRVMPGKFMWFRSLSLLVMFEVLTISGLTKIDGTSTKSVRELL